MFCESIEPLLGIGYNEKAVFCDSYVKKKDGRVGGEAAWK
jgi:hypothetical protein